MSSVAFDEGDFQGGIITPAGRRHTGYLLLRFSEGKNWKIIKGWLRSVARQITSVRCQKAQRKQKKANPFTTHLNLAIGPGAFGKKKLGTFGGGHIKAPFNIKGVLYDSSEDVHVDELHLRSDSHFLFIIANNRKSLIIDKKEELLQGLKVAGAKASYSFQIIERRVEVIWYLQTSEYFPNSLMKKLTPGSRGLIPDFPPLISLLKPR